ncbi:MAG: YitT family protein [Turicibacter sp.]|nr:YitT family protein [Turicibacter sp.]
MNKDFLVKLLLIGFGCLLMAFGIINFGVVNNLATGGFTGITLIVYHLFGISTGLTSLLLNIPAMIVFYRYVSKKTFLLTVYGIVALSASLSLFEWIGPFMPDLQDDMILAVLGFGLTVGLGTGILMRADGTTGGAAIVAKLLKDLFHIPIDKTFIVFDAVIVTFSLLFFVTPITWFYSILALYIMAIAMAKTQEGFGGGYQVLIFSDNSDEITQDIQKNLDRGVTYLHGKGAYSKFDRKIVLVVVSKKELLQLKRIIYAIDPECFVSVSHTYETLGRGFTLDKKYNSRKFT